MSEGSERDVSESEGRYLRAIHLLTAETDRRAKTGELAAVLDVSDASVTGMVGTLADRGLADYRKYEGVTLTDDGEAAAREFAWRRCVAENFLEDDLNVDVAALREADGDGSGEDPRALGQVLSDEAVHRLKEVVDHPCDGACRAPHDEYDECSSEVRTTAERVESEFEP
ncbi:metal-dependent transcriptional regulator [Halorussus gelatinilyticus]|uniref:Metal-dependent transcriptional regulator n=1 Tax=Halorussus gelatinilyticus TaxID=2937524 RepID=A0A8U0INS8_9EURY|nr:metal-dependent transcriptional regulator [Halorussus gelatinilyticus]UPW02206.1 metal-dependent transcriptional regulator [Halorussus gelatinilyticus]